MAQQPQNPQQPQPQPQLQNPQQPQNHLPVEFHQEGHYWKIVGDRSFFLQMIETGIEESMAAAKALVGPDAVIASTWCMDFEVIQHLAGVDNIPREPLTCVSRGKCETDLGCISKLVGEFNSENLIVATQDNMHKYSRVARLPVLTFNSSGRLVYWPPSPYQVAFSILPPAERAKKVLKEASKVYKKVRKVKQLKRKV